MASTTQSAPATGATNPSESDIYDRQIRLWGAEAQVSPNNVNNEYYIFYPSTFMVSNYNFSTIV